MGWYADALKNGTYLDERRDRDVLDEFRRAADALFEERGGVDAFLREGSLHLSSCRRALATATARKVDGEIWSPDEVRAICACARWDLPPDPRDHAGFWSVRCFLELCSRFELGMELSI